jgi:aryl-alcohol dehydrogenase-like predicted oxidoreductase
VTVRLGNTELEISRVGFGAWAIGGAGYDWGWGEQDDADSIAAIHRALELGLNWIDTAAHYCFGHSEEVVGRALEGLSERPYVFTKAGQPEGPGRTTIQSLRRDSIRREIEGSLSRLGVEAIDLYQIHWPIPDEQIEEGWSTFAELKGEGLVRHIGVSNFGVEQIRRAQAIAPVETLQPSYSLIARDVEREILPFAENEGVGVIVYSPMGSGLLTGAMTRERIASLPTTTGASAIRASTIPATSTSPSASAPSPSATAPPRVRSRSPGRFGTRQSTARSSGSAGPIRSSPSSRRRASSSPTKTSPS